MRWHITSFLCAADTALHSKLWTYGQPPQGDAKTRDVALTKAADDACRGYAAREVGLVGGVSADLG
jgi:hypothetical protein